MGFDRARPPTKSRAEGFGPGVGAFIQMLVNLAETYNANKQRLEDVSQGLKYAAYTIWGTTAIMLINIVVIYMTNGLQAPVL